MHDVLVELSLFFLQEDREGDTGVGVASEWVWPLSGRGLTSSSLSSMKSNMWLSCILASCFPSSMAFSHICGGARQEWGQERDGNRTGDEF